MTSFNPLRACVSRIPLVGNLRQIKEIRAQKRQRDDCEDCLTFAIINLVWPLQRIDRVRKIGTKLRSRKKKTIFHPFPSTRSRHFVDQSIAFSRALPLLSFPPFLHACYIINGAERPPFFKRIDRTEFKVVLSDAFYLLFSDNLDLVNLRSLGRDLPTRRTRLINK